MGKCKLNNEQIKKWGSLVDKIFILPSEQIELASKWNQSNGWGFSVDTFEKIKKELPKITEEVFTVAILDISLHTIQETFEESWLCASEQQKKPVLKFIVTRE